jgi:hypothetical protein
VTGSEPDPDIVWRLVDVEHSRQGVEWELWRLGDPGLIGRVDANGAEWFLGDYDRAADLFRVFSRN